MNRTQRPNWFMPNENSIEFVQYLHPHGLTRRIWIEQPPEIVILAKKLKASGCVFDAEVLRTSEVSMTVMWDKNGDDEMVAIEIVPNGPQVKEAVARLIRKAHRVLFEQPPSTEGDTL